MAQLVTYFPHKQKDLSLDPKHPLEKAGHIYHMPVLTTTGSAETGGHI